MSSLDSVKFRVASAGTGSFVVATPSPGFITPATAGMANGRLLNYIAFSDDQTQWEYGTSSYTVSGTSIARSCTNGSSGLATTVNFTSAPTVAICLLADGVMNSLVIGASKPFAESNLMVVGASGGIIIETLATASGDTCFYANNSGTITGNVSVLGDNITATGDVNGQIWNGNNAAGATSTMYVSVSGAAAGDPIYVVNVGGSSFWSLGLANADADKFKIAYGSSSSARLSSGVALTISTSQGVVVGNAALATSATDGFMYIPTCAGTPTGTPTNHVTGTLPMIYDTTNHKFWMYDAGWKGVVLS